MADKSLRDVRLGDDGDLASASATAPSSATVSGEDAIRQHLQVRLRLIKGECPWDLDLGVDYFGTVLRKGATDSEIATELQRVILGTPGVASLRSLDLARDKASRTLAVAFKVVTDVGLVEALVPLLEGV